jgi:hypothetical protein
VRQGRCHAESHVRVHLKQDRPGSLGSKRSPRANPFPWNKPSSNSATIVAETHGDGLKNRNRPRPPHRSARDRERRNFPQTPSMEVCRMPAGPRVSSTLRPIRSTELAGTPSRLLPASKPEMATGRPTGFAIGKTLRRFLGVIRLPAGTSPVRGRSTLAWVSKVTPVLTS